MALKSLVAILVLIAAVSAVPHHKVNKESRPNYDFVDYGGCKDKPNGNYQHPWDCTRFITCSNGLASDMACPDCDQNNVAQCAGSKYLYWDDGVKRCEWPQNTECSLEGTTIEEATTPETVTEEVTTKATTTKAPTTPTTEEPTTEEEPETEPTHPPEESEEESEACEGRVDGAECDKDDCRQCGFCLDKKSFYYRCVRQWPNDPKHNVTGKFLKQQCDENLWWNPDAKPAGVIEGGICDHWNNLSDEVQNGYKNDPKCVEELCEYGQEIEDACTGKYWYYDSKVSSDRQDLSCSDGLIWDTNSETCRNRANVQACNDSQQ